jgi:hypothetical protein
MGLPNFLVIGVERSGTSWLHQQLSFHPNIYMTKQPKEVHFFDRYYQRGLSWYQKFFPVSKNSFQYLCLGESTPGYIYYPEVPARIYQNIPNCKLIAILRNPVDRAYSKYQLAIRNYGENRSFEEYLKDNPEVFARGLYSEQIKRYLEYFSLDNFLILIFEEVMDNPKLYLDKIANFLSVDSSEFQKDCIKEKINSSSSLQYKQAYILAHKIRKWLRHKHFYWVLNAVKIVGFRKKLFGSENSPSPLEAKMRKTLLLKYEPDISSLENLLKRDLSLWR